MIQEYMYIKPDNNFSDFVSLIITFSTPLFLTSISKIIILNLNIFSLRGKKKLMTEIEIVKKKHVKNVMELKIEEKMT